MECQACPEGEAEGGLPPLCYDPACRERFRKHRLEILLRPATF